MRHVLFCYCLEGCRFNGEGLEDGFSSAVGSINSVSEAEEKGPPFPCRSVGQHLVQSAHLESCTSSLIAYSESGSYCKRVSKSVKLVLAHG